MPDRGSQFSKRSYKIFLHKTPLLSKSGIYHRQPLPQQLLSVCVLVVCLFFSSTVVVVTLMTDRQAGRHVGRQKGKQV
jgi:hypothetical protein